MEQDYAKGYDDTHGVEITLEGFVYANPNYEFDLNVYMLKPIRRFNFYGNAGGVDQMVENFVIGLSCGWPWQGSGMEPHDFRDWPAAMKAFYRVRKKGTLYRQYWKRVIFVYPPDDERVFEVKEEIGATI